MRVAISSCGPSLDSPVDERFGRARYLLIVDTEAGLLEAIDNHVSFNATQGAGINSAQAIADRQVGCLITGHVGPKAYQALQRAGISVYTGASGTCSEALARYKSGEYVAAGNPDVSSHW